MESPFNQIALKSPFFDGEYGSGLALNLNFTTGYLDRRITFSRGSNATLTDSTGKITYAPANLLTYSQDFTNAAWNKKATGTGSAPVVTANAGLAPDGTNTASQVVFNTNAGTTISDQSILEQTGGAGFLTGAAYVGSVYVKGTAGAKILMRQQSGGPYTLFTLTGNWDRLTTAETSAITAKNFEFGIRQAVNGTINANITVLVWGAQLEPVTYQTTPSAYVATTASAYYGPRFDYDPITLQCKGLLIEEQRTNLVVNSVNPAGNFTTGIAVAGQFGGFSSGATMPGGTIAGPDGVSTSMKQVTFGATTSNFGFRAAISNNTVYTFSVWLATASGTFKLKMTQTDTNTWTTANVSNEITVTTTPTRYTLTFTTQSTTGMTDVGIGYEGKTPYNLPATGSVYIYGYTLEQGAFATSYIPTTTATATRNADVASMTGSNFSSWYNQSAGTFVSQFDMVGGSTANPNNQIVLSAGVDASNRHLIYNGSSQITGYTVVGGVDQAYLTMGSLAANVASKMAYAYQVNDFAASKDGGAVSTDTSGSLPSPITLGVGSSGYSTAYLNGHIASIQYYNKRLPNATLQQLTQPSLVPSMSLVFDTSSNSYIDANWSP